MKKDHLVLEITPSMVFCILLAASLTQERIPKAGGAGFDGLIYAKWVKQLSLGTVIDIAFDDAAGFASGTQLDRYLARRNPRRLSRPSGEAP